MIFNRLKPASITVDNLDIQMHLASSDLLSLLQMFVDQVNENISCGQFASQFSKQQIGPHVVESKLKGLVAKVLRTYQREYRKYYASNSKSNSKD